MTDQQIMDALADLIEKVGTEGEKCCDFERKMRLLSTFNLLDEAWHMVQMYTGEGPFDTGETAISTAID